MPEKVGFPGAKLPGKAQTMDRSRGMFKECKVDPDQKGLC